MLVVSALISLFAWSLASAPSSSPDDNYHLGSIWCAQQDKSTCETVPGSPTVRMMPLPVVSGQCYATDNTASAKCQEDLPDKLVAEIATDRGNWNGGYPPLFYKAMSFLVTDDYETSVVLMRFANSIVTVGLIALVALLVPRRLRGVAVIPAVITSVPLGLSVYASTNPSAWTTVSAATLWLSLYAAVESSGRRQYLLLAAAVVATLIGSGSRTDAALFSIMAVGLVFLIRLRDLRRNPAVVVVGVACVAVSAVLFLRAGQSGAVIGGIGPSSVSLGLPWLDVALMNLRELPVVLLGSLGYGPMGTTGWLDTPYPALVGALTVLVWAAIVFESLHDLHWAKSFGLLLMGAALIAYPMVLLGRSGVLVGAAFQPRYALPLLIIFTGVALLNFPGRPRRLLSRTQLLLITLGLAIAHALAIDRQIRRYVTGVEVTGLNLDDGREWWWPGLPLSATAVLVIGSVAFAVMCVSAMLVWQRADAGNVAGESVEEPAPVSAQS